MNSKDSIEMKEIKVSKGKALLQFLGRHIVAVYLVVIFAILLFGNIAKAEEMAENVQEYVWEIYHQNIMTNTKYDSYLQEAMNYCPYFAYTQQGSGQYDMKILTFTNVPEARCYGTGQYWNIPMSYTDYGAYQIPFCYVPDGSLSPGLYFYSFMFSNGTLYSRKATPNTNYSSFLRSDGLYEYPCYISRVGSESSSWNTTISLQSSPRYGYGNLYIRGGKVENTIEPITYVDDERLKIYKLWSSQNGDSLVLDLSDFRTYTAAAAYNFSNINVTLSTNGVETVYTLPLANSSVNDGWNNQSNLYTVSTPLSDFTLSDAYDTFVTKVSFDMVTSSPGGTLTQTFYVSTNFPLDLHHSAVTPEVIPTPVYDNPVVKFDVELTQLVTELNNKSTLSNNGSFTFATSDNVPSWADTYRFVLNRYSDNSDSVYAGRYIDGNPNDSGTNYIQFEDVVYPLIDTFDNVYDAFIFPIHSWYAGSSLPSSIDDLGITGYLIFYTNRYFQRQESLTDVDILTVLQKDADNFVDFVDYLQKRVDDFELKTTQILNPLYDEVTYVDDKLASILYAVNSIETYNDSSVLDVLGNIYDAITGIGGTDTSNIESKLDTLINHFIANNSQENTAYKQFVTWLRDVNGKPVQYVSTGYEFFTELFDYFPFTRDLDGSGGFSNMFDMGKGFIDISTGHTTGIPENYQGLSYYFNSANDGTYNVQSMSGR